MTESFILDREQIIKIIPQHPPMLLIDGLITCDCQKSEGTCSLTVGKHFNVALNEDLSLPSFALVEVMAQTTAIVTFYTLEQNHQKIPDYGLLLSIRNFKIFHKGSIAKDTELIASSSLEYEDPQFRQVHTQVKINSELICEALLTVFTPI